MRVAVKIANSEKISKNNLNMRNPINKPHALQCQFKCYC